MSISEFTIVVRTISAKHLLFFFGLLMLAFSLREHMLEASLFALANLWQIAPIILIGLLITAFLTATGSVGILVTAFYGREVRAIVIISLIGAVLPVCGITVLPLVAGLLAAGISLAPVMAFLLSSAVTDPEMIVVTTAMLGWPFALGKTLSALGIGLLGGGTTLVLMRAGCFQCPTRQSTILNKFIPQSSYCEPLEVNWKFWRDQERLVLFRESGWSLAKLVLFWLSAAFVAEYFLKLYLPADSLAGFVGNDSPFSVPIAAIFGAPLYLDGYAALPFVRGLMDKGMAVGPAMTFLIAGGIISAWTAIPVFALFRLPVFLAYVVMAIMGAMLSGWAYAFVIN
ncbi:MAG: permease [Rhodospirillales bacterium]|nr:permease [Rhodospirillales bacterium]